MRRPQNKHLIITILTILSLLFLCVFSDINSAQNILSFQTSFSHSSLSTITDLSLKSPDRTRILENSSSSAFRTTEEMDKEAAWSIRENRRICRILLFALCLFLTMLVHFLAVYIPFLIKKAGLTPRYSVILYLHRSDGKKSALTPIMC